MKSSIRLGASVAFICMVMVFALIPVGHTQALQLLDPTSIPKFINQINDPPPVFTATNVTNYAGNLIRQDYTVSVSEFSQQVLPTVRADGSPTGFGTTRVWGYQGQAHDSITGENLGNVGSVPGCTFEVVQGIPIQVKWVNSLLDATGRPLRYLVPVDTSIHWANPNDIPMDMTGADLQNDIPPTIVTHLHGGENPPASDGHPDAWWTSDGKHGPAYQTIAPTEANSAIYQYPNSQPPATLWYHDHALGLTRLNILSGLAGFYLIRNSNDSVEMLLPSGEYEIPLAIQDRSFYSDGSLHYPDVGNTPQVHPKWQPSFLGNTITVNGLAWPNMDVKQGVYRLRLLDGSNSRFYQLSFSNGMAFTQIGSDGGYLKTPVELTSKLIAPGERIDILVDFSNIDPGTKIILRNTAEVSQNLETTGQIMQFTVIDDQGLMTQPLPSNLNPTLSGSYPSLQSPDRKRILTMADVAGLTGSHMMLLDGQRWSAPVSETPVLGSMEEWVIVNPLMEAHPIHLHLAQFQIISRQSFNVIGYLEEWLTLNGDPPFEKSTVNVQSLAPYLTGTERIAQPDEQGWKDTVNVDTGEVATIRIRWTQQDGTPYPFDTTQDPGYVWHCHILEHEDNEMMRPYKVVNSSAFTIQIMAIIVAVSIAVAIGAFLLWRHHRHATSHKN